MATLSRLKPLNHLLLPPLKPHSPPANPSRKDPSINAISFGFQRDQSNHSLSSHNPNHTTHITKRRPIRRNIAARLADAPCSTAESQLGSRARGVCFYAATVAVAIPLFVAMAVAHPFVVLLDRHRRRFHHLVAKVWAMLSIAAFYRFEVLGLENLPSRDTAAVYVANHRSFLDTFTVLTLGRCFKFISKRSIFVIPIVGWAMFLMGLIPLRRMDSRSRLDCLKRCIDLVRKGASVFFYPEGTRSKDGKLGIFKKGAFSVAAKTGAPVVPISLLGTGELMPAGMEGILNSGSVKVVIHEPIEGKDADMLCKQARNVIADTLTLHGYGVHISQ